MACKSKSSSKKSKSTKSSKKGKCKGGKKPCIAH